MATTFLEAGGDSTGDFKLWGGGVSGAPSVATDFVHGAHVYSIKYRTSQADGVLTGAGACADAGTRMSIWIYLNALPSATATILKIYQSNASTNVVSIRLTSGGVIQLWNATTAQIGSNGATLSTGTWYRISLAYTITSTSVNSFNLFVNGTSSITVTNATVTNVSSSVFALGNLSTNSTLDMRSSDHYIDNSSALTDTGNVWVTAKRPFSNGTTNGFTTQIGSGGSGYGTGHAPQVNERPLSTTDGWSMVGAGSAVTEEYSIETASAGDINLTGAVIVDYMGWVWASSTLSESASIIVGGSTFSISTTSTQAAFIKIAGSSTYPGGGTDIGVITATTVTTFNLYEAGIVVAFRPAGTSPSASVSPSASRSPSSSSSSSQSPSASRSPSSSVSSSQSPSASISPSSSVSSSQSPSASVSPSASLSPSSSISSSISPSSSLSPSSSISSSQSPSASISPSASRSPSSSSSSSQSPSASLSPSSSSSSSQSPSSSLSPSSSISSSISPSSSLSPSSSSSSSLSPSASTSPSSSASSSLSPSASLSPSSSISSSLSPSASLSPSSSISASLSPSASISPSSSRSPSSSISASISPSASVSPSSSQSSSISPSASISPSSSSSPSLSPSASLSPSSSMSSSISPSSSLSPSASVSISPSLGYEDYSRQGLFDYLPTNNADLQTLYTAQEVAIVSVIDGVFVDQTGTDVFMIHQFKNSIGFSTQVQLNWKGKSTENCSVSPIILQIWNELSSLWQTVASDGSALAEEDVTLTAAILDTSYYINSELEISCRVFQEAL